MTSKTGRFELKPSTYNNEKGLADDTKQNGEVTSDDSEEDGGGDRAQWGRQFEFILSCIGFAVGLGNVWRFPYKCYKNGGGAFLIPYVIMLIFVGIPIFFLELAFGQFASSGPITVWRMNPVLKGVGYCSVAISAVIALYYNVVIAYCIFYFFASMSSEIAWNSCDNEWNSCICQKPDAEANVSWVNYTRADCQEKYFNGTLIITNETESPSREYWNNYVLKRSSGLEEPGELVWRLTLCLLLAWIIVFAVLFKGIKSLGKVVYFTAIFPYVLLTAMLIRGVTLDGAYEGVIFYLRPDWERLKDATVWSDAATQIFFSLSACQGGLIAMASYNKFSNNCMRDAFIVPVINCLTSFYAGFVIFSVLGFMAKNKGVTVDKVADSGPGLAFVVYPEGISQMPLPPLWAILFFLMMITLGFSSQFSIMETVITGIIDEYRILRKGWQSLVFRISMCLGFFAIAIPMTLQCGTYLQNLVDNYIGGFPLLFVGFFELTALNWVYGYNRFAKDIEMMLGQKPFIFFRITWCFVSPLLLLATIVFYSIQTKPLTLNDYEYPDWGISVGWLITAFPLVFIPGWAIYYVSKVTGFPEFLWRLTRPLPDWGPLLKSNQNEFYRDGLTNYIARQHGNVYVNVLPGETENEPQSESRGASEFEHIATVPKGQDNQTYLNDKGEMPYYSESKTAF
ncbi:sodium- and chloride-dependent glycine transporter 1-like isoform X2 [Liolophura sinensis]|uniref:sodium- and chloride-dependent glycine transporter 1-like isoform X2 n=1 Tax=Liolophura sinensis TaxID=3198878 RepID=UPI003158BE33